MSKRYITANEYFKKTFGQKTYKLALDGAMTCPNRDGTLGHDGCIFCSAGGSGDFAEKYDGNVSLQIERAKKRVSSKIKDGRFIAYFQSYTNTYADVKYLENLFMPAIIHDDIAALSIGTRPDCLPDDVLNLINRLCKIKPVFVELGLQTIHQSTADFIRRGYTLDVYDTAVKSLKKVGANVVTHVILGLPHEDERMMLDTVKYVGQSGADGIKLQLLHVLKGTALEKMYLAGEFETLTLERYVDILCQCIEIFPDNIVIHRLTGDAPKKLLVAPMWSADKKRVLNTINAEFAKRGFIKTTI